MKVSRIDFKNINDRLEAAQKLLSEETTSKSKFDSIKKLLKGINPKLDQKLSEVSKVLNKINKIKKVKIIDLSIEHLPEKTKEQKKRKKSLLLFLRNWKQLKSEVKRVKSELVNVKQSPHAADKVASGSKIAALAKGPLGTITAIAAIIAGSMIYLQSNSVEILVTNQGCETINPGVSLPFSIPGISFPDQPIGDGQSATISVPPLTFNLKQNLQIININAYKVVNLNFEMGDNVKDIALDGKSLLGGSSQIKFLPQSQHQLILTCVSSF